NGSFALRGDPANVGSGILGAGSVVDPTAWDGQPYRVVLMPNGDWEARDAADATVASGAYTSGGAIEFKGIRLTISGAPVAGDQFHVDPSGTEDIFATLDRLARSLESPVNSAAQRSHSTNELNAVLAQLAQGQEQVSGSRAVLGARLGAIDAAETAREAFKQDVTTNLSQLRDVDYVEALTRLNTQLAGLQAAQQSVAKLSRLSLFDYL
ncbi:MAG: flagellar biosynthesis protein FlgL, partial [Gammaproteobacteria bacterium]|nr:flagellar biosynthesis protein FlgL [Gammaproteobacteria bacterium]